MANGTKDDAKRNGLAGLRILCLESRRGKEMAKLIANYGGETVVAPSMQEVPLRENHEAIAFGKKRRGEGSRQLQSKAVHPRQTGTRRDGLLHGQHQKP